MSSPRGRLIVIEGLDRTGKSTQVARLVDTLSKKGHKAEQIRFPNRSTPIGQSINAYLRGESHSNDHAIHLLFSANRWEAADEIKAKIDSGVTLIVDRYSFSGAVYSAAKGIPDLDLDWAWNMEIGLPQPDLVLYLTVPPEVQAARGGFGAERYETEKMQIAVRECFEELFKCWTGNVSRVQADKSLDEVAEEVLMLTEKCLTGEVGSLQTLKALVKPTPSLQARLG